MIRVVIVDDHLLVRQGIRALLTKNRDIDIIGEASTGDEAVNICLELTPDVVLMDIAMPRMDGIQATRRLLAEKATKAVLALSMHSDTVLVQQMLHEGARGYVLKTAAVEELCLAIHAAYNGHMYLSPAVANPIFDALRSNLAAQNDVAVRELTMREREVLQLIVEGNTTNAIADTLSISPKTVEKHRSGVMQKLGVRDLASLVRIAIKHKLVFTEH